LTTRIATTQTPSPTPTPTRHEHGFIVLCLPAEMHVHIKRKSLPDFVDPSLLRLDDPRCGVVQMDDNDVMLTTPLKSCGTTRRTYDEHVSFHNKVVAESGVGLERSLAEFPFRCSYKKLPSASVMNNFQPLYKGGQEQPLYLYDLLRFKVSEEEDISFLGTVNNIFIVV
ncbi:Oncoprotein-induced transcript 3 protein, partial [Desmophyllum pertusum]